MTTNYQRLIRPLKFERTHNLSYGFFECPSCGAQFYSLSKGSDMHERSCMHKETQVNCSYVFGEEVVKDLKSKLQSFGIEYFHGCWTELGILKKYANLNDFDIPASIEIYAEKLRKVKYDRIEKAEEEILAMREFWAV